MPLDDIPVEIFKFIDDLLKVYSRDINSYREIQKNINTFLQQKEIKLREIEEKAAQLLKESMAEKTIPVETEQVTDDENFNYAGVKIETPERLVEMPAQESETPTPKTARDRRRKIIADRKAKAKSSSGGKAEKQIKCLYHPKADAVDKQRQLCSSCKWKLISNGLSAHDKDPDVIAFLKGQTKIIPLKGQPMCPVHPEIPAYNKKTGLCYKCQIKARALGIKDRPLTDDELELVRGTVVQS